MDSVARLKGAWYRWWHRTYNRGADLVALLVGACNASTWDGRGYAGGYAHWRCMRGRGHAGVHRFENYVWPGQDSRVQFDPLPVIGLRESEELRDRELPFRSVTSQRFCTDSRRRARLVRDDAGLGEGGAGSSFGGRR